jgi:ribosomal protein L6P/L9E
MFFYFQRFYSHVGKRPIIFPDSIKLALVNVPDIAHPAFNTTPIINQLTFSGPLGNSSFPIHYGMRFNFSKSKVFGENNLILSIDNGIFDTFTKYQKKFIKSMWGTSNAVIKNIVQGVSEVMFYSNQRAIIFRSDWWV